MRFVGIWSRADGRVPHSLDEALALPSIEEELHSLTARLEMDRLMRVARPAVRHRLRPRLRTKADWLARGTGAHRGWATGPDAAGVEPIGCTQCAAVGNDHRPNRPWVVEVGLGEDGPVVGREQI